jgi:hypothetical protein
MVPHLLIFFFFEEAVVLWVIINLFSLLAPSSHQLTTFQLRNLVEAHSSLVFFVLLTIITLLIAQSKYHCYFAGSIWISEL